jgi:excisionase family DNA binding protein
MMVVSQESHQEVWLTPQQVADQLQLDIRTVRKRLRSNELRGYKFGANGDWRIKPSDLQAFLERSTAAYHKHEESE